MAKYNGSPSRYLRSMKNLNYFVTIAYFVLLVYLYFGFIKNLNFGLTLEKFIILTIIFAPFFIYLKNKAKYHSKEFNNYRKGSEGEDDTCKELMKLSDDYYIYEDLKLLNINGYKGNIDFVVIGPTGVFAIEVKNMRGNITFENNQLLKDQRPISIKKNFISQTIAEALQVREYLKKQINKDYFVFPVLVFSNRGAKMRFGYNTVNDIHILGRSFLNQFILSKNKTLSDFDISKLDYSLRAILNTKIK